MKQQTSAQRILQIPTEAEVQQTMQQFGLDRLTAYMHMQGILQLRNKG
jgi:hypothetical protein